MPWDNHMMKSILIPFLVTSSLLGATKMNRVVEDTLCLYALDSQMHGKHRQSSAFFSELYKQTGNKEYLYQSLKSLEYSGNNAELKKAVSEAVTQYPKDVMLRRFEIIELLKAGNFSEASQKALVFSNETKGAPEYLLYAETQMKLGSYQNAVSALQKAYAITADEATAERLSLVMYGHLGKKEDAIEFLKKHISVHGNSVLIGKRLGSLLADSGKLSEAAEIYSNTFEHTNDESTAQEAVKIYVYQQDLIRLESILEKSGVNDPMLIDLYVRAKSYEKASKLASKLYEEENNPKYLAQSAVFMYEGAKDKNAPAMLTEVVDKLTKAVEDMNDALYLNYLGYLLIDHDIDIDTGMMYVKKALEQHPDSPFYIDSLAWGHYKLHECSEAKKLIDKVQSMEGGKEQEVIDHANAIQNCKPSKETK